MWEEKPPPPECEFCWMEASSFLVVWGARPDILSWPGAAQGVHGTGTSHFCGAGPAISVVMTSRFCGALPSRFRGALPSVVPLVHWSN